MIIVVGGGSSIPFQLVFGAYSDKFIASVIKESSLSACHATIQVTKKKVNLGLGQELMAFRPWHRWWEIDSVDGVLFIAECD